MIRYLSASGKKPIASPRATSEWIKKIVAQKSRGIKRLYFYFVDDDELLAMNRAHLNHDDYTDVLTFDYSENDPEISGEIYISLDRARENAGIYGVGAEEECRRVMIHGVLHLLGYDDSDEESRQQMRAEEDKALAQLRRPIPPTPRPLPPSGEGGIYSSIYSPLPSGGGQGEGN